MASAGWPCRYCCCTGNSGWAMYCRHCCWTGNSGWALQILLLHWQQRVGHVDIAVALAIAGWPWKFCCWTGICGLAMYILLLDWQQRVDHVDITVALATDAWPWLFRCCTGNSQQVLGIADMLLPSGSARWLTTTQNLNYCMRKMCTILARFCTRQIVWSQNAKIGTV